MDIPRKIVRQINPQAMGLADNVLVQERFRLIPIAFVVDIKKAFLQIKVKPADNEVIWFLGQIEEPPAKPRTISFTFLPFGLTCRPALWRIKLFQLLVI